MTTRSDERPKFWIIAGANGSGKSSAYTLLTVDETEGSVWIINPDLLAARIRVQEKRDPTDANLESVKRIGRWLRASIRAHQTVGVETVLSTGKYRKLVRLAKQHGFEVRLIYVALRTAEMNIERVRLRVADGGHDVPQDKIIDRRRRSFEQLPWFFQHADRADVIDNSGAEPTLLAIKRDDDLGALRGVIPELDEAMLKVRSAMTGAKR